MKTVASLHLDHIVVVRCTDVEESSERARRKSLMCLLAFLAELGVYCVCAEARQRKQNDHDLKLVRGLRSSHQIDHRMRLEHVPGREEPLLWIADMVAGAYAAWARDNSRYLEVLGDGLTVVECDP
jgi:hypothetical protein